MCTGNPSWSAIALRVHISQSSPIPDHAFLHFRSSPTTFQPAGDFCNHKDSHKQTMFQFCYLLLGSIKKSLCLYSTVLFSTSFKLFFISETTDLWPWQMPYCHSCGYLTSCFAVHFLIIANTLSLFTCSSSYFYCSFTFKTCKTWFPLIYFLSFNMKQLSCLFHLPVTLALLSFLLDFHNKKKKITISSVLGQIKCVRLMSSRNVVNILIYI